MESGADKPCSRSKQSQTYRQTKPCVGAEKNVSTQKSKYGTYTNKVKFRGTARPAGNKKTYRGNKKNAGFNQSECRDMTAHHIQAGIPNFSVNGEPQRNNQCGYYNDKNNGDLFLCF